mmetsp:Transcript_40223/g.99560  ORF Transcript_40223/g.99560 Transcript_40223/m.99560 type:complete len:290 (+) Transcript_40223:86-955(+)
MTSLTSEAAVVGVDALLPVVDGCRGAGVLARVLARPLQLRVPLRRRVGVAQQRPGEGGGQGGVARPQAVHGAGVGVAHAALPAPAVAQAAVPSREEEALRRQYLSRQPRGAVAQNEAGVGDVHEEVHAQLVVPSGEVHVRVLALGAHRLLQRVEVVVHRKAPVDPQLGAFAVLQVEHECVGLVHQQLPRDARRPLQPVRRPVVSLESRGGGGSERVNLRPRAEPRGLVQQRQPGDEVGAARVQVWNGVELAIILVELQLQPWCEVAQRRGLEQPEVIGVNNSSRRRQVG